MSQSSFSYITRIQPFFPTIELFTGFLHLGEIQKIIKVELKGKSGIYGFLCETTGKLYIGSSINLSSRFNDHFNGTKSNIKLQNAINKYNFQDFIFIVFEYRDAEELLSREQFYLDELTPEYNLLKVAGSSLGLIHSEESKILMSFARSGISGELHPMYGRTHSAESKALISKVHKGIILSEKTKALISEARNGKNSFFRHKSENECR